jgi:hypothetical protein
MVDGEQMNGDTSGGPLGPEVLDPVYLPFTEDQLREHFKPVNGSGDHLAYFRKSAKFRRAEDPPRTKPAIQMEKDERFWVVTTLKRLYDHRADSAALATALQGCLGAPPGDFLTWKEALGEPLRLYFEVALPAPARYREYLRENFRSLTLDIPNRPHPPARTQYEGKTWVDAVLVSGTGVAVLFEAKVFSDISCRIEYDATRNQIARTIDVMLERNDGLHDEDGLLRARRPEWSFFVLLTPELFKEQRESRLYGWLMQEYEKNPELLQKHLAHRLEPDAVEAARQRLGWLTWEKCHDLMKGSPVGGCAWLEPEGQSGLSL